MTQWGLRNKTVDVSATVNAKAYADAAAASGLSATASQSSGAGASSSVGSVGSVGSAGGAAAYDALEGLFILSARGGERIVIVTNQSRPECNMSSQTEIGVRYTLHVALT